MENLKTKIQFLVNLYKSRNLPQAEAYAKKILRENPNIVFLYNILGLILNDLHKIDDAIDCFQRGLQINPENKDNALIYNNLGSIYFYRENYFEAENCYKKAIEINRQHSEAFNNLGNLFIKQNKYEEGINYYKKAIHINNNFIAASYNIAIAYKNIGNFSESKKYLTQVIKIKKNFFTAHRTLSEITKYEKGNEHLKMMLSAYEDNKKEKKKNAEIAFAIGKAYNDIKDYQKSYSYYSEGNKIRKKYILFSKDKELDEFKQIKKIFNEDFLKKYNIKNKDSSIIFIVGMPRSGTTLVEQIISSHSKVYAGDELNILPELINKKFKNISNMSNCDSEILVNLSGEYLNFVKKISNNSEKITDKLPINFKWIGLIRSIFPNSKVVHCVRNPKDVCFSIYKNYFTNNKLNFAYDIDDIVFFFNLYSDLMIYWKKLIPNFIIDVDYEDLVSDSNSQIKKLIKLLDLNWDEKCIKFYENKRPIKTASDTQVRQSIYKSSINTWKNFEDKFLKSFKNLKY